MLGHGEGKNPGEMNKKTKRSYYHSPGRMIQSADQQSRWVKALANGLAVSYWQHRPETIELLLLQSQADLSIINFKADNTL